jgi:hypothetical protein
MKIIKIYCHNFGINMAVCIWLNRDLVLTLYCCFRLKFYKIIYSPAKIFGYFLIQVVLSVKNVANP